MKELPVRKKIRLKDFNYSQSGYYFITICVKDRHEVLGRIVGDGVLDVPSIQLSEYGQMTEKQINEICEHYDRIEVDKFVIMPNHIHMLVVVKTGKTLPDNDGTSGTPSPANALIPLFISTLKRFIHKDCGFRLFQRSFHDHIIRNEAEYQKIWQYIDENPLKWEDDCFYVSR